MYEDVWKVLLWKQPCLKELLGVKHHCIFIFSIICSKNTEETKKKLLIIIFIVDPEMLGKSEPKAHRNAAAYKSVWLIIEKNKQCDRNNEIASKYPSCYLTCNS